MDFTFLASFMLVLAALIYSYKQGLGIEKSVALNSVLAMVQLGLLGFLLIYALKLKEVYELFALALFMSIYAAFIANRRSPLAQNGYITAFLSLFFASFSVLCSLLLLHVIKLVPNQAIPIFGMIIGNALNIYTQLIERIKNDVKLQLEIIEGKIALGATVDEALSDSVKSGVKASMMPTINSLQTVGLIHIPGVTAGMLMAGANPMTAVSYQLVIMYMMVANAMFTAIFAKIFGLKKIFASL